MDQIAEHPIVKHLSEVRAASLIRYGNNRWGIVVELSVGQRSFLPRGKYVLDLDTGEFVTPAEMERVSQYVCVVSEDYKIEADPSGMVSNDLQTAVPGDLALMGVNGSQRFFITRNDGEECVGFTLDGERITPFSTYTFVFKVWHCVQGEKEDRVLLFSKGVLQAAD